MIKKATIAGLDNIIDISRVLFDKINEIITVLNNQEMLKFATQATIDSNKSQKELVDFGEGTLEDLPEELMWLDEEKITIPIDWLIRLKEYRDKYNDSNTAWDLAYLMGYLETIETILEFNK